jgi:hypothetical protein
MSENSASKTHTGTGIALFIGREIDDCSLAKSQVKLTTAGPLVSGISLELTNLN